MTKKKARTEEPETTDATDEHVLGEIASDGVKRFWICSCSEQGLPVGDIVADGKVFASGVERATRAHEYHVDIVTNPEPSP